MALRFTVYQASKFTTIFLFRRSRLYHPKVWTLPRRKLQPARSVAFAPLPAAANRSAFCSCFSSTSRLAQRHSRLELLCS